MTVKAMMDPAIHELLSDLVEFDEASIHEELIESLRANDGERFRAVIRVLQCCGETEAHLLAQVLKGHPLLLDLIPN